jgi:hypothetical protein
LPAPVTYDNVDEHGSNRRLRALLSALWILTGLRILSGLRRQRPRHREHERSDNPSVAAA